MEEKRSIARQGIVDYIVWLLGTASFNTKNLWLYDNTYIINQTMRQFGLGPNNERIWQRLEAYITYCSWSKRAFNKLEELRSNTENFNIKGKNKGKLKNELHKYFKMEDIVPISQAIKAIQELDKKFIENNKINLAEEVGKIIDSLTIVIVLKEEAAIIDGNKEKEYPLDGKMIFGKGLRTSGTPKERMDSVEMKIAKETRNII